MNLVLTKQHLREVLIFCFNWKKSAAEADRMLIEVYDTAPTDKSCKEWFRRFMDEDFSVEDKPRWTAKKIRRQRIRGITRRRSESNARGACRIIGDNSSRFCTREGIIQKQGNWVPYELKRRRWKTIFHLRKADSKTTEKKFFASDCDWRWEVDILRQPQEEKILR